MKDPNIDIKINGNSIWQVLDAIALLFKNQLGNRIGTNFSMDNL